MIPAASSPTTRRRSSSSTSRPPLALTPAARDAEALRAWFASHPGGPVGYEVRDLTLSAGGDVASDQQRPGEALAATTRLAGGPLSFPGA